MLPQRRSDTKKTDETKINACQFGLVFAAAGCNQNPGTLATLPTQELVAYGSGGNVFVLVNAGERVSAALPFFQYPVASLTLEENDHGVLLVGASSDGCIAVWSTPATQSQFAEPWSEWKCEYTWDAHIGSVVGVDVFWCSRLSCLAIVSAGLDSMLRTWTVNIHDNNGVKCQSEYCLREQSTKMNLLPECVSICSDLNSGYTTEENGMVIAVGVTHPYLYLFEIDEGLNNLRHVCTVSGHRDWIHGVAFSPRVSTADAEGVRFIASASKDSTVRIWRLSRKNNDSEYVSDPFSELGSSKASFSLGNVKWEVSAVALLKEHENSVYSVSFDCCERNDGKAMRLVTASMDCSIAIFHSTDDKKWACTARFGLLGGAGAHALGFFGSAFVSTKCEDVVGHNFGGGIHCWRAKRSSVDNSNLQYTADCAPSGHFDSVTDLDWDPSGRFILTCSKDKTARVFLGSNSEGSQRFAELARPQTHGHAIYTVAISNSRGTQYVSGSEESMLRMFEAPSWFAQDKRFSDETNVDVPLATASAATRIELGLSNKAFYSHKPSEPDTSNNIAVISFGANRTSTDFPLEEELKQNTLWPETLKLYGHGNTISCVKVCINNGILASSCYAQRASDACIRIWDLKSGLETQQLEVHDLTVTGLSFSKDGLAFLSVSRDRSFAIHSFSSSEKQNARFTVLHRQVKAHSRQIFDGTWIFNRDFIVTCGRDKYLRFFSTKRLFDGNHDICNVESEKCQQVASLKYSCGISAVDAQCWKQATDWIVAVGFEDGNIRLLRASSTVEGLNLDVKEMDEVPGHLRCSGRVTRMQWRPSQGSREDDMNMHLAVASEDNSIRILSVR